jgi:hypothetical protein
MDSDNMRETLFDACYREANWNAYRCANIVYLDVHLGLNVVVSTHLKLNRLYIEDKEAAKKFFAKHLGRGQQVFVKIYDCVEGQLYYLVDMYAFDERCKKWYNFNEYMIDEGVAIRWSDRKGEDDDQSR